MLHAELTEVRDRIQRAKDVANALSKDSLRLVDRARNLRDECARAHGRRVREDPTMTVDVPPSVRRVVLGGSGAAPIQGLRDSRLQLRTFRVEGRIGDHLVTAHYEGGVLDCNPLLRTHAELVVAVGDTFRVGDPDHAIPASLDGPPVIMLLTLMRASFVTNVQAAV